MGTLKKILRKIGKWIGILLLVLISLFIIIILLIRTPWAQNKIVNYATSYASDKTGTTIDIDRLFITFTGSVQLEGLYVEGREKDTLLYSRSLEAGVGVRSLFSDKIRVTGIDWHGLRANLTRSKDSTFNFSFIIDAFAGSGDTTTADSAASDTASSPPGISLGPINFTDFHITYLDSLSGIDALLHLGTLYITTDDLDMKNSRFELDEIELTNTSATVVQFLKPPPSEDTSSSKMPFISWDEAKLENIELTYTTKPDTLDADVRLGSFTVGNSQLALSKDDFSVENLELLNSDIRFHSRTATDTLDADVQIGTLTIGQPHINLSEKIIAIESFEFLQNDIRLQLPAAATETADAATEKITATSEGFTWPEWQVELDELLLAENNIRIDRGRSPAPQGVFDPDHLGFSNFKLEMEDVQLQDQKASLDLIDFAFAERSGFELRKLGLNIQLTNTGADINNLQLITGNSQFNSSLQVDYKSINSLLADPLKNGGITFNIIDPTSLSVEDAFYFNDSLRYDTLIQNIAAYPIDLSGKIEGRMEDIRIYQLEVKALAETRFLLDGRIRGLPDTNSVQVNLQSIELHTTDHDIALLFDTTGQGIKYPAYVDVNASLEGNVQDLDAAVALETPEGEIDLEGQFADLLGVPGYRGGLKIREMDFGKITNIPDLESVSMTADFDGQGIELATLQLDTDIDFQQLDYKGHDYSNLELRAKVENKKADVHLAHTGKDLDFDLDIKALLEQDNTMANLSLDLRGADLEDLNFTNEEMRVGLIMEASFARQPSGFDSQMKITKGIFIKSGTSYRLDSLFTALTSADSLTYLKISSEIIAGELESSSSLNDLSIALESYIRETLSKDSVNTDSAIYRGLSAQGGFHIASSPMLTDIFLPNLTRMDSIDISMDFTPAEEKLDLQVIAPEIVYQDSEVEQLILSFKAGYDTLQINLGFDHLLSGPVEMHTTRLFADITGDEGDITFSVLDQEEEEVFYTSVDVNRSQGFPILHVKPDHLVLNRKAWQINPDNEIRFQENLTNFSNFILSKDQQQARISTDSVSEEMLLDFTNFNLAAIFSILNAEEAPLAGYLHGNVRFTNIVENPAFTADITLNNLKAMGTEVGTLNLNANNRQANQYVVDLSLNGENIDLSADGSYSTTGEDPNLKLGLDINQLKLALVKDFIPDQLRNVSGGISGHFDVEGPTSDLRYEGSIQFNQTSFEPIMLGSQLSINNSSIEANNERISFQNFNVEDANGDKLTVKGKIGIEDALNPDFDLQVKANSFMPLNSTEEDNDLFWGKAIVNLDLDIGGDAGLPEIDARIKIREGTDLTYAVPASQAQIEERKGLVRFKNMKDTLGVLTADEDEETDLITGMDVSAYVQIEPKARFNVLIDPQSNDQLSIAGEANLNFELTPNGNTNLSGSYEVTDGSYQLRLYELVQREFKLMEGSRIVWSGDPTGASLDLTAIYNTETSAVDLMAQELAGADQATINRYKQRLPFQVLLYIEGEMDQPRISFGLDMPDRAKDAMGGSIYTRVQQLEQDENELNKQVFSLLVFNRFLPSGVGGDEGGGTSAIARSSVSNLLTNQLNQLSERYIQGVELNFDVDSYTDYRTGEAQQRTDLNISLRKSFLDDRVVVEVGSQVGVEGETRENNVVGDVSVEYLLTEDGRYRARAFRKNQYQDILEGQVIIMGLGVLFNKEFDTFNELMRGVKGTDGEDEENNEPEPGENGNGTREDNNEKSDE